MWEYISNYLKIYANSKIYNGNQYTLYIDFLRHADQLRMKIKGILSREYAKCVILCESGYYEALSILTSWGCGFVPIPISFQYGLDRCKDILIDVTPDLIITDNITRAEYYAGVGVIFDITKESLVISLHPTIDIYDNVAAIMYTSGTSGKPKGTLLGSIGFKKNIEAINEYFDIYEEDKILIARPLCHCAVLTGEFLAAINRGLDIYFFKEYFDPLSIITYAQKHKITVMCGTPTFFYYIAKACKRRSIKNLFRIIALSGECLTEYVGKYIREVFQDTIIYNVYGMTEASPRISYLDPIEFDLYPKSVGYGLKGITIAVKDNNGQDVPNYKHARVYVKTPSIMLGYYKQPGVTEKVIRNGWLNTGDIGYFDFDKRLYIVSRYDEMIIKAGMNIYPKEIENKLLPLAMISEIKAYGIKNLTGQAIGVDVVLENGYEYFDKHGLMKCFAEVLPDYLLPQNINICKELKRNATGKLIRSL